MNSEQASQAINIAIGSATLAAVSIIIAVVSAAIAFVAYRQNRKIRLYEYAVCLLVKDEDGPQLSRLDRGTPFTYKCKIANAGMKRVTIEAVYFAVGGEETTNSMQWHNIGRTHIPVNQSLDVSFTLSAEETQSTCDKFSLDMCHFAMRILYLDFDNNVCELKRRLGAAGMPGANLAAIFVAQSGDALT